MMGRPIDQVACRTTDAVTLLEAKLHGYIFDEMKWKTITAAFCQFRFEKALLNNNKFSKT
jgi:hypothetical protein